MTIKRNRSMKVLNQSGYRYSSVPAIVLKGKWLSSAGFAIGDYVTVSCEDGRLVITPDTERAAMVKAEAEFMEREMRYALTAGQEGCSSFTEPAGQAGGREG